MSADNWRTGPGSKLPSPSLSASFRRSETISTAARTSILTTPASVGTRIRVSARALTLDKIRLKTARSSAKFFKLRYWIEFSLY